MNKFKPGQKVICLRDDLYPLFKKGEVYTFLRYNKYSESLMYLKERFHDDLFCRSEDFIDAAKYLHDKEFKNKLDNLIED